MILERTRAELAADSQFQLLRSTRGELHRLEGSEFQLTHDEAVEKLFEERGSASGKFVEPETVVQTHRIIVDCEPEEENRSAIPAHRLSVDCLTLAGNGLLWDSPRERGRV